MEMQARKQTGELLHDVGCNAVRVILQIPAKNTLVVTISENQVLDNRMQYPARRPGKLNRLNDELERAIAGEGWRQ